MEGEKGASSAGQQSYEKEWAEYYARMGWGALPSSSAAGSTSSSGGDGGPSAGQSAPANAAYGAQNPWGAPSQQYPSSQPSYPGYQGYGGGPGASYPGTLQSPQMQGGGGGRMQQFPPRRDRVDDSSAIPPSTNVWVGNIPPTVFEQDLHQAFGAFGAVREVKLLRDKSCAFVRFNTLEDATLAHRGMQGATMHGVPLKVGWGKPDERAERNALRPEPPMPEMPAARNLWIGNLEQSVTEDDIRSRFAPFGPIERVNVLPQKNCAFVNFVTLESALKAKEQLHGLNINGRNIRVNFGKQTDRDREELATRGPGYGGGGGGGYGGDDRGGPLPPVALPQPPAPQDPQLKETIDKLAMHVVKAGPQLEETIKARNAGNPTFSFLSEGGEFYDYYKWKLFDERQKKNAAEGIAPPAMPSTPWGGGGGGGGGGGAPWGGNDGPRGGGGGGGGGGAPWGSPNPNPPQSQAPWGGGRPSQPPSPAPRGGPPMGGPSSSSSVRPTAPPPTGAPLNEKDRAALSTILDTLTPTKEAIKTGKDFIMARPDAASAVASFICQHLDQTPDFSAKLNMIYLTNDVLHHSMKNRNPGAVGDVFCDAFKAYVPVMLWSAYQNTSPDNQAKVTKMIDIWRQKGIYNTPTLNQMTDIVTGGASQGGPPGPSGPPQGGGPSSGVGGPHRGRGGLGYAPGPEERGGFGAPPGPPSQMNGGGGGYNNVPPPSNLNVPRLGGGPRRTFSAVPDPAAMMNSIDDFLNSAAQEGAQESRKRGRSPSPESRNERARFR